MAQPRRRAFWIRIGIAALAVILVIIWYTHRSENTGSAKGGGNANLQAVGIAKAQLGPMQVEVTGLGTVTPRSTVTVHSQTDGQLMKVYFTDGQLVKAGDPLADLDARPAQATLLQAQGQKTRDEALLATAKIDLSRYQTLLAQDSIAKQQVDTQASLVKQYAGAVQADEGQIDAAKVQLAYSHIKAPVSGRVGLRQLDPGNIVHTSDANGVVVITQLQPIDTLFTVPEDRLGDVMKQMNATSSTLPVEVWDRTNKTILASGTLVAVDNQVDVSTGTVKLKAEFPNTDHKLFPNQFVNARLQLEQREDQVIIPASAIQQGTKGPFVYVVTNSPTTPGQPESGTDKKSENKPDDTKPEATADTGKKKSRAGGKSEGNSPWVVNMRTITVGPAQDDSVSILNGLQAGEVVVTDGADKLRDNARVAIPAYQKNHNAANTSNTVPATPEVSATASTPENVPETAEESTTSATQLSGQQESPAHHRLKPGPNNGGSGNGN